jgi:hypothetical protein
MTTACNINYGAAIGIWLLFTGELSVPFYKKVTKPEIN